MRPVAGPPAAMPMQAPCVRAWRVGVSLAGQQLRARACCALLFVMLCTSPPRPRPHAAGGQHGAPGV